MFRIRIEVAVGAFFELGGEEVVAGAACFRADIVGGATGDVHVPLGWIIRVFRHDVALGGDTISAGPVHAAEHRVKCMILHQKHHKVIDLALPGRRRVSRLELVETSTDLIWFELMNIGFKSLDQRLAGRRRVSHVTSRDHYDTNCREP